MSGTSPLFRIRAAPQGTKTPFIIVVPRKNAALAVTRNRIRRRIRAALRKGGTLPTRPTTIVASEKAADTPFSELVNELQKALKI